MKPTDSRRIKHARVHLRDCPSRATNDTRVAEYQEPCAQCEAARALLAEEQPLTRAEFYR
jgi:hypothetical protein